uniref:Uncharacterized protein n=1 Tax=Ditylenchus dipsaci TaxID=166011 RepID=A0A915DNN4_9BILA
MKLMPTSLLPSLHLQFTFNMAYMEENNKRNEKLQFYSSTNLFNRHRSSFYRRIVQPVMQFFFISRFHWYFTIIAAAMSNKDRDEVYLSVFLTAPTHWIPVLNPLITIIVVKPYRQTFIGRKVTKPTLFSSAKI